MTREWTGDELLRLAGEFRPASVLAAAVDIDVFNVLSAQPMAAEELSARLKTDLRATTILLDALASLELLAKDTGIYSVPASVAAALTDSSPATVLPMVQHQAAMLRRWAQLPQVVCSGRPAEREFGVRGREAELASFIGAMHVVSAPRAAELAGKVKPEKFSHLLDVGGASGSWTIAFLNEQPEATATLFDRPEVIPMAEPRIADAGMADRVKLVGGDFNVDDLPPGADFAWVGAIVHMLSREQMRALFGKVRTALVEGGRIAVCDVLVDETRTQPQQGALFAVNMLVATEGGTAYRFEDIRDDLIASGFSDVELLHRGEFVDSIIRARKA